MSHPRYIEVHGQLYRIVEAEQEAPMTFRQAIQALSSLYTKLFAAADIEPGLNSILEAVKFARSAAQDVEKKLPDALRPGTGSLSKWSLSDEFMDTLQQLNKTYKKLHRAWVAADRRKAMQQFLAARGIHTPEAHRA